MLIQDKTDATRADKTNKARQNDTRQARTGQDKRPRQEAMAKRPRVGQEAKAKVRTKDQGQGKDQGPRTNEDQ